MRDRSVGDFLEIRIACASRMTGKKKRVSPPGDINAADLDSIVSLEASGIPSAEFPE